MGSFLKDFFAQFTKKFPTRVISVHPQTKAFNLAKQHIGLKEIPGPQDNQEIVKMFAEVGHAWVTDDETAWCAAFAGAMFERVGVASTKQLTARSYMDWGTKVELEDVQVGDLVVFWRGSPNGWQGHVGFFVGWADAAKTQIKVLGGNQGNSVNVSVYSIDQLLGFRRAIA